MMIQAKKNPESAVLTQTLTFLFFLKYHALLALSNMSIVLGPSQALLFSAKTSSKYGQGKLLLGLSSRPRNKQKGCHSDSAFKGLFGVDSEHFLGRSRENYG